MKFWLFCIIMKWNDISHEYVYCFNQFLTDKKNKRKKTIDVPIRTIHKEISNLISKRVIKWLKIFYFLFVDAPIHYKKKIIIIILFKRKYSRITFKLCNNSLHLTVIILSKLKIFKNFQSSLQNLIYNLFRDSDFHSSIWHINDGRKKQKPKLYQICSLL